MRSISVALLLAFAALSKFATSSPSGPVWYVTNAGDVNQSVIAYINNDGGNQTNLIGAGGLTIANAITINVIGVNNPPSGANHTLVVTENTSYTFAAADFGFTDPNDTPPNTLLAVEITTLPAAGTLTDNSTAVSYGQFIPVADITGGKLLFTPAMNASGTPYATFTFQVQDDGGTGNGGIDTDPTPKTMTVNVNPVLPPSITKSFGAPFAVVAQVWPLPARTQNTEVPCNPCPGNSRTDLMTVGYSSPITTYTGRFLDSQRTATFQQPFRTARAETVTIAPQLNRIYMMIGSAVVAYDINTFFNRLNSRETLTSATSIPVIPTVASVRAPPYELFLQWDKFFYAENGSPWQTILADGQQRLFQIDYDDQGYVYLAYSTFGWGIVKDDGGTGGALMQSVFQDFNGSGTPAQIVTFKSSTGRYYAMVQGGRIFDTTDRTHPQLVRTATSFQAVAKDSTLTRLAVVNATGGLEIWRTDDFIAGGAPLTAFSSGATNGYSLVTSDGTNFYADVFNNSTVTIATVRYDGSTYTQTLYPTSVNIFGQLAFSSGFRYGAGFITIAGISATAPNWDVAVLKMNNGVPSIVDLHSYFKHYYSSAPDANHITPFFTNLDDAVVYTSGSHDYLIVEAGGLGDVYEIDSAAGGLSNTSVAHADSVITTPTMPVNATTSLSFTITNPNATLAFTGVAFTDPLPPGLAVATPNGLAGSCGAGTIATTVGSITLSGGTIPASGSCSFSVNVIGTAPGVQSNTTGTVSSTEGGTGATSNTAIIDVIAPPSIAKAFSPPMIARNATSTLTFTITNPAANPEALTGVGFTDNLPAGLAVASPNGLSGSCGGGTITAAAGSTSVTLSNGSIAVAGNCSFSINVLATVTGNLINTTGNVTSTNGGTGNTATASLQVGPDLTIAKAHTGNFTQGQTGKTYTITVTNAGSESTAGTVTVVDTLPSGLTASAISGSGWTCTLATLTCTRGDALAGNSSYPAITVTVSVNSNAGPFVANVATVSGGGEANTGNDVASDLTNINPSGLIPPTNLVASATSSTQVTATWNAVTSAVKYQLYRSDHHGAFAPLGAPVMTTTASDSTAAANTTYVYMVAAIDGSNNISAGGNIDIATTIIFTDDPVVALSTAIKAVHITELRTAVNAVAAAAGMSLFTFTDSSLSGMFVKAVHIVELQSDLNTARSAIGVPVIAFTDPGLGAGTVAKAVHVQELRSGVK